MSHFENSDSKPLNIVFCAVLLSSCTLSQRMFQLALSKINKHLKHINTSMNNLILMQKNDSFDKINGVFSYISNRKDAFLLQFIINIAIAILQDYV